MVPKSPDNRGSTVGFVVLTLLILYLSKTVPKSSL